MEKRTYSVAFTFDELCAVQRALSYVLCYSEDYIFSDDLDDIRNARSIIHRRLLR